MRDCTTLLNEEGAGHGLLKAKIDSSSVLIFINMLYVTSSLIIIILLLLLLQMILHTIII